MNFATQQFIGSSVGSTLGTFGGHAAQFQFGIGPSAGRQIVAGLSGGTLRLNVPIQFKISKGMIYFDRNIIRTNWKRINRTPLQRAANLVRVIARRSIRHRRYGTTSAPGTPPYSHRPGNTPPFKMIYAAPTFWGTNAQVLVGMVGFGSQPAVPGLHEHGGFAIRQGPPRWRTIRGRRVFQRGVSRRVYYPPRPFMWPALLHARQSIPQMWRGITARLAA